MDGVRPQGAFSWELTCARELPGSGTDSGRTSQARRFLAPVHDRFIEGFGTPDLTAAQAHLTTLRSEPWSPSPTNGRPATLPPSHDVSG